MDNNELDKILKEKLKDTIKPNKEFEDKIKETVKEQTKKSKQKESNKRKFYMRASTWISVAAVFIVIFSLGIVYKDKNGILGFPNINNLTGEDNLNVVTIQAIEPTKVESGIVAKDSEFIIKVAEERSTVESVQRSLYIEPALEYEIEKTGSNEYKLKFKQNIPNNVILKLQYVKDQITEDSWAYQTNKELSVTSTFPTNGVTSASTKTTIEVEFSYANVENLEKNITISPKIDGVWKHLGKTWRFIPSKELQAGLKYTIKVNKDVSCEEKTMKEDYVFQFEVDNDYSYSHVSISQDEIETSTTDEPIRIFYNNYSSKSNIGKVVISKFNSAEEFIKYLNNKTYENATKIGEYEFDTIERQNDKYIQLNKNLEEGYYVASIQSSKGKELFNCPIQKNNIQTYMLETERDVIAWVAKDGNLAKDVEVTYLGKTQKTDANGIATFKGIADGTEKMKYATVGTDKKLVVGVVNFKHENYPSGYIYVDRPLYKNTDTINVWGFVPRALFYDEIDDDEFYIQLGAEEKQKVTVNKDGNFNYKIKLKNHISNSYGLELYYKDSVIAYTDLRIKNYELENYNYEIIANKNYAFNGDTYEFDVKVTHITGIGVPNKNIAIKYNEKLIRQKTDETGTAHVSLKIKSNLAGSGIDRQTVSVYNADAEEYSESEQYLELNVISKDVYTDIEYDKESSKYTVDLYKLLNNKKDNIENIEELYDGKYDTNVEILLDESKNEKYLTGHRYDEYTKQNEPVYAWMDSHNILNVKNVKTNNGKIEIDKNLLDMKKDTENISYYYSLIISYNDRTGKNVQDSYYIGKYSLYEENLNENSEREYYYGYSHGIYNPKSNLYRYALKENDEEIETFKIGDSVILNLCERINGEDFKVKKAGKLLKIVFQEDITKTEIFENNEITHTFSKEDFPGCEITAAYFVDGKFYRISSYNYNFDKKEMEADVEITSDKEQYKPGDKVTLNIKTTNKGNPIKTFVNVSVVNEAVFKEDFDNSAILDVIYSNKLYSAYTYSSYLDYIDWMDGGDGSGGGEPRSKFGDTAYFETVYTDRNGVATVTFTLPDNITSYRVTAHSANADLYVGENKINITSTLDFFIQFTEPKGVKSTDDLVISATSVSEKINKVDYEFTIEELNKKINKSANSNSIATANFGKLPVGRYTVTIKGTNGVDEDAVQYKFEVVESAQEKTEKKTFNLEENATFTPAKNPITLEIYNEKMKQYIDYIEFVESTLNKRLDTRVTYNIIQNLKSKYYGEDYNGVTIDIYDYTKDNDRYSNLEEGKSDLILTALTNYFAKDVKMSYINPLSSLNKDDNVYEYYLYLAANEEPVLKDLKYLEEDEENDNYNKLLLTLSYEFLGDYDSARNIYSKIEFSDSEKQEYASLIAISDTFINKNEAANKINEIIKNNKADEYVRFAVISFLENNSNDINKEESVKITSNTVNETIKLKGLQIKKYTIYDSDLNDIKFESTSKDLMVSYYYQTLLENAENENISKDITIKFDGKIEKENNVNLVINFNKLSKESGEIRIALPNSLRLAKENSNYNKGYFVEYNGIEFLRIYKNENTSSIKIPLLVTLEGNYKFESIVFTESNGNGICHISNSIDF